MPDLIIKERKFEKKRKLGGRITSVRKGKERERGRKRETKETRLMARDPRTDICV